MGDIRKSYPRFKREGGAARIELTEDDIAILRHVYRHRFIRADDLYRLFGERSRDKLSRRLTRLYRNHFVDRPIAQVDRFREGGSRAMVYGLDNAGAQFIKETFDVSITSADWKSRNRSYTRDNLDHTLSISRFLIDVELACRARDGIVALIPFDEILAIAPEKTRRLPQPGRWSVPVRWHGNRADVYVIPDAIFGLRNAAADGKSTRTFVFLEIDRGTMTIAPAKQVREGDGFLYRATILRKLLTYAESYREELHKTHLGIPAARVLTLTTSAARAESMRKAAQELIVKPFKLPPGLFLFGVLRDGQNPLSMEFANCEGIGTRLLRSGT
jgi:hypothetical protein